MITETVQTFSRLAGQSAALCREYVFPGGCPICGKRLLDPAEAWYGLCADCTPFFDPDNAARCDICGRPLISEHRRCASCKNETRAFDGVWALYPYAGKYRRLLGAYKFGAYRALGHFFAETMAEHLVTVIRPPFAGDAPCWVPVPPQPGKIRRAGWDQVALLGTLLQGLSRYHRRYHRRYPPVRACLKRLPSQSQKALDRETRKRNLQGRIVCVKRPPEEAIIFDDVITTGSTLDACAAALKAGGAQRVFAVALFYD